VSDPASVAVKTGGYPLARTVGWPPVTTFALTTEVDLQETLTNALAAAVAFIPQLIGFLLILLIGWLVARAIAKVIAKRKAQTSGSSGLTSPVIRLFPSLRSSEIR